jgi:uncharacterized protein YcfL
MRRLVLLLIPFALIGCSASAKYDIDVACKKGVVTVNGTPTATLFGDTVPYLHVKHVSHDGITMLTCFTPENFQIQCKDDTVQVIGDERFCRTHDGKNVRVRLVDIK